MDQSKKSSPIQRPTTGIAPATVSIDYRTLVKRSRYDQIETELVKLKARLAELEGNIYAGVRPKTPKKSVATETSFGDNSENATLDDFGTKNRRLSHALVNIEDDLHRILFILLHRYEAFTSQRPNTKPKALMIQAPESTAAKHENAHKETLLTKLRRESRSESQPNIARLLENELSQSLQSQSARDVQTDKLKHTSSRSRSGERLKPSLAKPDHRNNSHYHITKPDVHWILGTVYFKCICLHWFSINDICRVQIQAIR